MLKSLVKICGSYSGPYRKRIFARGALMLLSSFALAGCGAVDRIASIGKAPDLAPIEADSVVPQNAPPEKQVVVYRHPPAPYAATSHPNANRNNSLWKIGAKHFFKDQRASQIGDILTVNITINDEATINNSTTRKRTNSDKANSTNFLGLESKLGDVLPDAVDPASLVDMGSTTSNSGSGTVDRKEEIKLTVAAVVTQILPNGNLVIQGRQEVRVNFEVRELTIMGVVRPEDISSTNTIQHTQIAEARISYGGRGQLTDVQQPRYGTQLFDILFPF
ncbi:flagellar basal body L-ring protein FlgH [Luteithermobacter gelatinilyticus]|uniref:flagellar basal body L-ring protein FlgH n=1 Tax=Luteithermobacter gelatinilyticus TaxID=2582913 RepID=UPI001105899F|nr:flagellar basal body L-ring protein FlgH [Luteithermobacter gelatinilyticus]